MQSATRGLLRSGMRGTSKGWKVASRRTMASLSTFGLTDDQRMLFEMCRDFAENEIKPIASEVRRRFAFPRRTAGLSPPAPRTTDRQNPRVSEKDC